MFECEKQLKYEQRIREIEMGSFTPTCMVHAAAAAAAAVFYRRLAFLVSLQKELSYSSVMSWLHYISYSLLRSAV